ncbi:erythromycin esterase family protein [Nonomuraea fuscirosea]|uniref:erythromycin esterase family protein n=1 Tax=Nonomuraea fuscirosea TaxID=1291556 RepID=UPI0033CDD1BD
MTETVRQWIRQHAHPLTTLAPHDPLADLAALRDLTRDATVVALASSARQAHELSAIAHRMLRFLVEEMGFRSIALEGDSAARLKLDEYVRTGRGDPQALLADARSFWQTEEIVEVIRWMRAHNERHPNDPVRFADVIDRAPLQLSNLPEMVGDAIEQRLAEDTIWWHEHTRDKIVYWGGLAHMVNGATRTVSPPSPPLTHRNAGSYLRERFGSGYLCIGLTFHHGSLPYHVPAPPPDFAETPLGDAGLDSFFLNLHAQSPAPVRAWLNAPARTRLIGPVYDPGNDAAHHLSGGSLANWMDIVAHHRQVTPVRLTGR